MKNSGIVVPFHWFSLPIPLLPFPSILPMLPFLLECTYCILYPTTEKPVEIIAEEHEIFIVYKNDSK